MKSVIAILVLVLRPSPSPAASSYNACNQPNPCNPCQEGPVYQSPCCPAPSGGMGYRQELDSQPPPRVLPGRVDPESREARGGVIRCAFLLLPDRPGGRRTPARTRSAPPNEARISPPDSPPRGSRGSRAGHHKWPKMHRLREIT